MRIRAMIVVLFVSVFALQAGVTAVQPGASENVLSGSTGAAAYPAVAAESVGHFRVVPADQAISRHRIEHGDGTALLELREPVGTLVYSNTQSSIPFGPPFADLELGDDARLTTSCPCSVSTLVVGVDGGGDGLGPSFNMDYALYTQCPHGTIPPIAGTAGTMVLPDDGLHIV